MLCVCSWLYVCVSIWLYTSEADQTFLKNVLEEVEEDISEALSSWARADRPNV